MFKKGQKVFSRRGEEAEFIGEVDGTLFVYPMLLAMSPEGNDYLEQGPVAEWSEAFPSPPVKKLNEEVTELEAKRAEIQQEIRTLNKEKALAEYDAKMVIEGLKKYDGLQLIEDYLSGKITHYVIKTYRGVQIDTMNLVKADSRNDADWQRNTRLFMLFGTTDKKVKWELNEYNTYYDKDEVWPFTSLEGAKDKLKEVVLQELEAQDPKCPWAYERWVESAEKEGIILDPKYKEAYQEHERKAKIDKYLKAEQELKALHTELYPTDPSK